MQWIDDRLVLMTLTSPGASPPLPDDLLHRMLSQHDEIFIWLDEQGYRHSIKPEARYFTNEEGNRGIHEHRWLLVIHNSDEAFDFMMRWRGTINESHHAP